MKAVEVAINLVRSGLSVLPVRADGSKAPAISSWAFLQTRIPTETEIQDMFRDGCGVGIVAGAASGNLEVLDIEADAQFDEFCGLVSVLDPELLKILPHVETPSGGHHLFYRCQEIAGNQKLAMKLGADGKPKVLIETRGRGGYVVTIGSPAACHPAQKEYRLASGRLTQTPWITEAQRALLLDAARSFNEIRTDYKILEPLTSVGGNGVRPGDIFAQTTSWDEILKPRAWTCVGRRGDVSLWRRPGKDFGFSATVNFRGSDCLYVFTTNAHPFEHERNYNKFSAYSFLEHGGDFSAAARALAAKYNMNFIAPMEPLKINAVVDTEHDITAAERKAIEDESDAEGDGHRRTELPGAAAADDDFIVSTPTHSFVTKYVEYARQRTDAPAAAHELMAIGILSALAGPNPRLPISTNVNGWPLSLWTLYIVNSTTGRKTTVIDYATDIVVEVLGRDAVLWWEGSPQGFIQRLQERDGKASVFARDEYSGLLGQMNRGGHMAGLSQTFIRAFDGRPIENIRTKKRDKNTGAQVEDTDRAEHPYLVKLSASTWDSFVMRATIDNVLDGFLARFVVYTGSSIPRKMQRATPELAAARDDLITHARAFHLKSVGLSNIELDDDVLDLAWTIECEFLKRAEKSSRPDAAGPALKRLVESMLKAAALFAIDDAVDSQKPRLRLKHLAFAERIGRRWLTATLLLIDTLGRTAFQRDCEAVLATVRSQPNGMRMRDVYRKHRKLKLRDFSEVLSALEAQGEIRVTEGDNQKGPAHKWIVAPGRPQL